MQFAEFTFVLFSLFLKLFFLTGYLSLTEKDMLFKFLYFFVHIMNLLCVLGLIELDQIEQAFLVLRWSDFFLRDNQNLVIDA